MTPRQFYEALLQDIGVPQDDIEAARKKRDELGRVLVGAVESKQQGASFYATGALASGTQIRPLNDVDGVVEFPIVPQEWVSSPQEAMMDILNILKNKIEGRFELSTHAIKITYPDEDFTADVVVGWKQERGILIPELPSSDVARWIETDPKTHAQQVRERNRMFGSSDFSRTIRILKHLNREWKLRDPQEHKPLSSFHVTALALTIFQQKAPVSELIPTFLEQAAELVRSPLPDPAGVGEALESNHPEWASALLADAGAKTREALSVSDEEATRLLREVFGNPAERESLLGQKPVSVSAAGKLVTSVAAARRIIPVRSHGDSYTK